MLAPILFFTYSRPLHTKKTLEALQRNTLASASELFIFSDAPAKPEHAEKVNEVRKYLKNISGFKTIHIVEQSENLGCDLSQRKYVTEIIERYGKVIVVEDDIETAPLFLEFMNEALNIFEQDHRIWNVTGYSPNVKIKPAYKEDIYLSSRSSSWGWGMWKDRWKLIDWNKTGHEEFFSNSKMRKDFCRAGEDLVSILKKHPEAWDITSYYTQWKLNKYTICPSYSLIRNIGMDGTGVHFTSHTKRYEVKMHNKKIHLNPKIEIDAKIQKRLRKYYSKNKFRKMLIWLTKKIGVYDFLLKYS